MDQQGEPWLISYQPDWISRIKVSRELPDNRRRSSQTLFRNPERRARATPGKAVRTRVTALDGTADFQIEVEDPDSIVDSVVVVTRRRRGKRSEVVRFVLEAKLPPPR